MTNRLQTIAILFSAALVLSCGKSPLPEQPDNDFPVYTAPVPETTVFTNAEFIYNGDDIGEAISDGWVIKLYTDMDIDESGAPVGPGEIMQLLPSATFP